MFIKKYLFYFSKRSTFNKSGSHNINSMSSCTLIVTKKITLIIVLRNFMK